MNRKFIYVLIAIVLMMTFCLSCVYADEEDEGENQAPEETVQTVTESTPEPTNAPVAENKTSNNENDVERQGSIMIMFVLLLIVLAFVFKKKSIESIVNIICSVFILWFTMYVCVKGGASIIIMAMIASLLIIVETHIVSRGMGKSAYSAIIGSLTGTIVTGFLMFILGSIAQINVGFDKIMTGQNIADINVIEILFATSMIASVEIIMYISSNIMLRLDKVRTKNRDMEWESLFRHGIKVGEDLGLKHSKMLLITYVGNALVFALIYAKHQMTFSQVISSEVVAIAIISALAGTIGMFVSIPATSIAYAFLNKNKLYYKLQSDNIVGGKRSLRIK